MLVTKHTHCEKTDRLFPISNEACKTSADGTNIRLEDMQSLVSFQRITCDVKVVDVDDAMEVAGGKRKQDLVGDDMGQPGQLIITCL